MTGKVTLSYAASQSAEVVIAVYKDDELVNVFQMPVTQNEIGFCENANRIKASMLEGLNTVQPLYNMETIKNCGGN